MPTSFEDARSLILDHIEPLPSETVPLLESLGRALAAPLDAPLELPRFDNSAMDGYAVRSEDCRPGVRLTVCGTIPAGGRPEPAVPVGGAVKIMTGAPTPPGCDAIVPFEETDSGEELVTLYGPVNKGDHIRYRGEDIALGSRVLAAGATLRPPEISLLASFGCQSVEVVRRAKVAILSTGDELVEVGEPLDERTVVNSNSWSLAASVKELGGEPVMLGIARDNRDSLLEKLSEGLQYDALITSAGVSAGDRDLVREVLDELGVKQHFWKVDIKPGRPTAFASREAVPVFALPGNPVSTMITFEEFVRPALLQMMGHRAVLKPLIKVALAEATRKKPGRVQFMRVAVSSGPDGLRMVSSGDQNTGILGTMLRANAIAVLPAERDDFAAGEAVDVHLLGPAAALLAS
ncbi:MAG: molybdopterin molybdenumtransferase MoeA [Desulfuromonas sp.]|uniref:molybdopterin molybdotransferase MoeA n=1 Tax=Desulfuromonas sp. TaxID=892 RepID=UPI000CB652A9|nr:gephyrin-like molybdotransferase Glp [Desulfuromonas sp.]PLX81756.1 MAG: molybdopterin molybdenumtransferase MoeA [Desulfuromonas sp.]